MVQESAGSDNGLDLEIHEAETKLSDPIEVDETDTEEDLGSESPGGGSSVAAPSADRLPAETTATSSHDPTSLPLDIDPSSIAGPRNASTRFASLRAAFEQNGSSQLGPDGMRMPLPNIDRGGPISRDKSQYEADILRIRDDLTEEKELRTAYEERVTNLEEEIDELNSKLEIRQGQAENRMNGLRNEIRGYKDENSALQRQLTDLKRSISSSTHTSSETSDSTFKQEIGILQHEIQNWVVNHFRKAKPDVSRADLQKRLEGLGNIKHLDKLKAIYVQFEPSKKLAVYQATAACFITEVFEEPFLFGVRDDHEWREHVWKAATTLSNTLTPAAYNRWRAATFDALRQSEAIKEDVENATDSIADLTLTALTTMTDISDGDGKTLTSLKTIFKRVVALAHLIRVQQAQYEFVLPQPGQDFDLMSMDDISLDESGEAGQRTVYCATFPAIVKLGSEAGADAKVRNVLVKAKVLCDETD